MKTLSLLLAFCVAGAIADGFHGARRHGRRQSRRLNRIGGRRGRAFGRRGRQDDAVAPVSSYGGDIAPVDPLVDNPVDYDSGIAADYDAGISDNGGLDNYVGGVAPTDGFGDDFGAGLSDDTGVLGGASGDSNLDMLEKAVPGIPGEDYPIYASVPETAFTCDGQVEGGYYADPEAQCQAFHICVGTGRGDLSKYSFLCPNGTVFNQNYLICDWWFNFDCSEAEGLYSINDDIRAEQEANIGAVSTEDAGLGDADAGLDVYDNGVAPLDDYSSDVSDASDYPDYSNADVAADDVTGSPLDAYDTDASAPVFEETGLSETAGTGYGAPTIAPAAEEAREERRRRLGRGRGRSGRRSRFGSSRRGRQGRNRSGRRGGSRRTSSRRNSPRSSRRNNRRNRPRGARNSRRNFRG